MYVLVPCFLLLFPLMAFSRLKPERSSPQLTPWHGTSIEPRFRRGGSNSRTWEEFWINGSLTMVEIWKDLLPTTKLLFNGVPAAPQANG